MPNGKESQRRRRAVAFAEPPDGWIDRELEECTFVDERLEKRFRTLLEQLSDGTGESIPMACQDWANTKAAYRFLSNARVNEGDILAGHFQATRDRFAATEGKVLVLQDTSEFSYQRENPELIGFTRRVKMIWSRDWCPRETHETDILFSDRAKCITDATVAPKQHTIFAGFSGSCFVVGREV